MKVEMPDGRIVEMTRKQLEREVRDRIMRTIVEGAGLRIADTPVMRRLKIDIYRAAQTGKADGEA